LRTAFHHEPRVRLSQQQTAKLFLERHGCCRECGRKLGPADDWIVEHIIALENGGKNEWENYGITGLCCKAAKDARDHGAAAKNRKAATRHCVSKSMRQRTTLTPKPGWSYDWKQKRYVKEEQET